MDSLYDTVRHATDWLNANNGTGASEISFRLLKVTEEAGEVAAAWIGACGQNPRKGRTHTIDDVADELADVVVTALVAIASLDRDPQTVIDRCAEKIRTRLPDD